MAKKKDDIKNTHPIDKMVQDGLGKRQFPFDEKGWEEVQSDLDAYNASRRGRGFGFLQWFLIILVGAVVITESIFLLSHKRTAPQGITPVAFEQESGKNEPDNIRDKVPVIAEENTRMWADAANQDQKNKTLQTLSHASENDNRQLRKDASGIMERFVADDAEKKQAEQEADDILANAQNNKSDNANPDSGDETPDNMEQNSQDVNMPSDEAVAPADPVRADANQEIKENPLLALYDQMPADRKYIAKEKGDRRTEWYAEVSAGVAFTDKQLDTEDADASGSVTMRNAGSTMQTGTALGIHAGLLLQNISVETGAELLKISEDYVFTVGAMDIDTTYEIVYDSLFNPIDTITHFDTTNSIAEIRGKNYVHTTEIPLLVGYTWKANKWRFAVQTGPAVTFYSGYSVTYPNPDLTDVEEASSNYYKNASFYWIAKPSVFYSIREQVDIGFLGRFRWSLGDANTDPTFHEQYNTYAIQAGLRVRF
ncbi:MAG: hypothetical protein R2794_12355 [Chitinophagales bacterium]